LHEMMKRDSNRNPLCSARRAKTHKERENAQVLFVSRFLSPPILFVCVHVLCALAVPVVPRTGFAFKRATYFSRCGMKSTFEQKAERGSGRERERERERERDGCR